MNFCIGGLLTNRKFPGDFLRFLETLPIYAGSLPDIGYFLDKNLLEEYNSNELQDDFKD